MNANRQDVLVEVQASSARRLMASTVKIGDLVFGWEEVFRGPLSIAELENTNETTWVVARPQSDHPEMPRWDWAHLLRRSLSQDLVAQGAVVSIEPAVVPAPPHMALPVADVDEQVLSSGDRAGNCQSDPQDPAWPVGPGVAWHLGDQFSQLAKARLRAVPKPGQRRVRIGHVDTGYSPGHMTTPQYMKPELGWNFWRESSDTNDTLGGLFQGHGTRTLSVLAGNRVNTGGFNDYLGGAPHAEVVPIVADGSVVITNFNLTYWARAVEHAIHRGCDVISMSAGGIWIDGGVIERALREVERRGIVMIAAAGNRYCPPNDMVWPARYATVVAVTGAMADQKPYHYWCSARYYSSSFGPADAMSHAIAGYTPNITVARYGCPTVLNHRGDGTSHATPQVAAAAALWVQMHGDSYRPDVRARAVRQALFASAEKRPGDAWMFGNGILKANAALDIRPSEAVLEAEPAAALREATSLQTIAGFDRQLPLLRNMLEREATDLLRRMPVQPVPAAEATASPDQAAHSLRGLPLSATLRQFVMGSAGERSPVEQGRA